MGKGDTKTRRGKTYRGNYGNVRPHRAAKTTAAAKGPAKPAARKTAARKKPS